MLGFQTALAQTATGPDKGLANYDNTNDLETLLKATVQLHKDTLNALDTAVYNLPVLGPILGPSTSQYMLRLRALKIPLSLQLFTISSVLSSKF